MLRQRYRQTEGLAGPIFGLIISLGALGVGFFLPLLICLYNIPERQGIPDPRSPVFAKTDAPAAKPPAGSRAGASQAGRTGSQVKSGARVVKGKATPGVAHTGIASAKLGEQVYNLYCIACHQAEGMGKVGFAPFVRNPDFLALASDDFLKATIVTGRPGTAMVSWAHLKSHEIDSLVAYLRSAEKPGASSIAKADPAKKIPGDSEAGKGHYQIYCAACHGPNATGYAEGGAGPAIGNQGFLAVASDDFIFQTVKHGRVGTPMRGFAGSSGLANLSEGEIGNIIAYLRKQSGTPAPVVVAKKGGDPKAGEMHFTANCAACHQPNGTGKPGFAPGIGNSDFLAIASDQFIKDTVQKGRPGTAMVQRPDLSNQVLDDIIAYLRAPEGATSKIKIDPTKDFASLGDAKHGLQNFNAYCAACHGEKGKGYIAGGPGSAIGLKGFLDVASDDYIFQTLKLGRSGTAMRPFIGSRGLANLSEQDAYDIIAYLRSLD